MSDDEDVAVCAAAFIIISESERRERRFWVRPFLQSRSIYGTNDMLNDLRRDDIDPNPNSGDTPISSSFKNFTRISSEDFDILCNAIAPFVEKKDTNFRKAIKVSEQLAATLRFLATGDSYHSVMYNTKVSHSKISACVPEVCAAIIEVLKDEIKVSKLFAILPLSQKYCTVSRKFKNTQL